MNCVTRAFCYVSRKKVKSILLLFLLLVINSMVLGTLGIRGASLRLAEELGKNTESKVILECMDTHQPFEKSDVQEISNMDNVNWINRLSEWKTDSFNCVPYPGEADSEKLFAIHGYDKLENDSIFSEKTGRLAAGSYPQRTEEIIINQFLAEHNQIKLGDKIIFRTGDMNEQNAVVVGLFTTGMERNQTENVAAVNRIENQIYGTVDFVNGLSGNSSFQQLVVYINNPKKLIATKEVLEERYQNKAAIETTDHTFQKVRMMIGQTGRITLLVFVLTVIAGGLVVGLLFAMWMRSRKTEIAVFISLGISKWNILIQVLLEEGFLYVVSFAMAGIVTKIILPKIDIMQGSGIALELSFGWMLVILGAGLSGIILLTGIAVFPYMEKPVKEILSEMEG